MRTRMLLSASLVIVAVAVVDAVRGDHWDQVVMLTVLALLIGLVLGLEVRARTSIRLRPDLFAWVQTQAAHTDDEPRRVVARAVAAYRAEMLPEADEGADGTPDVA